MADGNHTSIHKTCSTCSQSKPTHEFYKSSCSKDGLRGECKPCVKAKQQIYNAENKDRISAQKKASLAENREIHKERRAARYAANPEAARARVKAYCIENPDKVKASRARHYATNRESLLQVKARYRADNRDLIRTKDRNRSATIEAKAKRALYVSANLDSIKITKAAHRAANQDRERAQGAAYRLANPEKIKYLGQRWRAEHPDAYREYRHNRRARVVAAGGRLSPGLSKKLFKLQKGKCPCCKQSLGTNYHMDHIIPLALGGSNTDGNMQLLRQRCNNQKYTKHPVDFMRSRGFLL